ncbi:MAG: 4-hydroxythreonine-4-phosphate dehydrogenase PdxA [Candidatus Bathyarchaeia archaeon]
MSLPRRPVIAVTMGDPAGIGPEITVKALSLPELYDICKPLVVGDVSALLEGLAVAKLSLALRPVKSPSEGLFAHGTIDVLDLANVNVAELKMGQPQAMAGRASVEYIETAVRLAQRGEVDAIVTGPISKEAVNMAGYEYPGHTEMLADFTGTRDFAMMLVAGNLRVIHVTTHVAYRQVPGLITRERVLKTIRLAYDTLRDLGFEKPRVAVAGLNPHRGEGGLFGREEIEQITPAVEEAQKMGIDVTGPLPPDTVFVRARGGAFDIVVAMYHDQGHIPIKMAGLQWDQTVGRWTAVGGVNVSVGLPIIRTSVDHGTAYGKAGRREGTANPQSLVEAVKLAVQLAERKNKKSRK